MAGVGRAVNSGCGRLEGLRTGRWSSNPTFAPDPRTEHRRKWKSSPDIAAASSYRHRRWRYRPERSCLRRHLLETCGAGTMTRPCQEYAERASYPSIAFSGLRSVGPRSVIFLLYLFPFPLFYRSASCLADRLIFFSASIERVTASQPSKDEKFLFPKGERRRTHLSAHTCGLVSNNIWSNR